MATGVEARGLDQEIAGIYGVKRTYAKKLLKEAAEAISLGSAWLEVSP